MKTTIRGKKVWFQLPIWVLMVKVFVQFAMAQTPPELMYYKFDNMVSGTTENSANASTRVGTAMATVTGFTIGGTGQFGAALQGPATSGTTAAYRVNPGWTSTYSGSWTISFWCVPPSPATTRYYFGNTSGNGTFRCFIGGAAGGIRLTGGVPSITLDMPNFASRYGLPTVVTYVYNQSLGTVVSYMNGVYQTSASPGSTYPLDGTNFIIGSQGNSIEGLMDEFRMYNRALTASEVALTYNTNVGIAPAPNNASVSQLVSPVNFCAGTQDIKVRIKNNGNNVINSVVVSWTLDGISQTPLTWTSPLDTFGGTTYRNDTAVTLGTASFGSASKSLVAWTEYPNMTADTMNMDDTLKVVLKSSLNGTYTIGGTTPDYPSVAAAAADLTNFGVCGPVVFNIRNGTYAGQVSLGQINGASATNTITFQSETNNRANVILTFASTAAAEGVIKMSNSSFVTFRSITVNQTNTTASATISITGSCTYDSIVNCVVTTAASNTSGTYNIYSTSGTNSYLVFKDNLLTGGYYGLYLYGTSTTAQTANNVVENNTISGAYYYTVYVYYTSNTVFKNNIINVGGTVNTTHYMVTIGYSDNDLVVTGNKLTASGISSTLYGLRIYYCDGSASTPGLIANNSMYFQTTGTLYGLYSYYSSYQNFYNNTVVGNSTGATNYPAYIYHNSSTYSNVTYRNNIFSNLSTTGYAYYVYNPIYIESDYNLFYSNSGNIIYKGLATATAYPNLPAYRAAFPTHEQNSVMYRHSFISATNLAPNPADTASWMLNGRGIQIAGNNLDINGNPRSTDVINGAPDMGAYEFTPTATAPQLTAIPTIPMAGSTQSFLFGSDTVAKITWDISATPPGYITGKLFQGEYPAGINSASDASLNMYWDFDVPFGFYSYDIKLYYHDPQLGTVANETSMIGAKKSTSSPWQTYQFSSLIDSNNNVLTISGLTDFSIFTGTDNLNPLPVTITRFQGNPTGDDVYLNWITAMEKNADYFTVEVSLNGNDFEPVGNVKARGNSTVKTEYRFTHENAAAMLQGTDHLYYRLQSTDRDGSSMTSNVIEVSFGREGQLGVDVFPNPFAENIQLNLKGVTNAQIEVLTLQGTRVLEYRNVMESGLIQLENSSVLAPGIYLLRVTQNGESSVERIVRK